MIKNIILWCVYLSVLLSVTTCNAQSKYPLTLVQNGESNYEIYISSDADSTLKIAVTDFQKYLSKISGVKLSITNTKKSANQIVVGDTSYIRTLAPDTLFDKVKKDGFIIRTEGSDLLISGIESNGTINGLYHFLEKYLGCRYYSEDAIKIPEKKKITIDAINDIENPAFDLRILHSYEAFSASYSRWHKLDLPPRVNPLWAKPWVHTTTRFVDPKKYYSTHPEYFMLWNDNRISTDIDWSNSRVYDLIVNKLNRIVETNPDAKYLGVSQADYNHDKFCKGQECSLLIEQQGAPSGAIINFVNKVATRYPDKTITTLAYHYSQVPPSNLQPKDNVLVILCNYPETNRKKATYPKSTVNAPFIKDLKGWEKLTDNVMVWDYVANHRYPIAPHPNMYMLPINLKTFSEVGVEKIFLQAHSQKGSEFQELRSYLLAKLLWDPFLDIELIMNDFLENYYGDAAPFIKKYIDTMDERMQTAKRSFSRVVNPYFNRNSYLTPDAIKEYKNLFDKAEMAVEGNEKLMTRVDKARQPLRYTQLEFYKAEYNKSKNTLADSTQNIFNTDVIELFHEFTRKAKRYGTTKIGSRYKTPNEFKKFILNK